MLYQCHVKFKYFYFCFCFYDYLVEHECTLTNNNMSSKVLISCIWYHYGGTNELGICIPKAYFGKLKAKFVAKHLKVIDQSFRLPSIKANPQ